ncbi:MAG: GIY-YIG nuclease family protein [Burkholderiales bacterium]
MANGDQQVFRCNQGRDTCSVRPERSEGFDDKTSRFMKPFWCYIVECSDGALYTGHTDELERRVAQHQQGYFINCYTYKRRPVNLIWSQEFESRIAALDAERTIKGWTRAKKMALAGRTSNPSPDGSGRTEKCDTVCPDRSEETEP